MRACPAAPIPTAESAERQRPGSSAEKPLEPGARATHSARRTNGAGRAEERQMPGVLDGIRVLDFGRYIAGP